MAADYRERGIVLPEGAVRLPDLTIGGKTPKELEEMLDASRIRVSDCARGRLRNPRFTTSPDQKTLSLVRAKISYMGLTGYPTLDQIYRGADELSWDLCSEEVAVYLRLATRDQPLNDWFFVGMKPIAGRGGGTGVFELEHGEGGLWLDFDFARPDDEWDPRDEFVFSPRPPKLAPVEAGK